MNTLNTDDTTTTIDGGTAAPEDQDDSGNMLAIASIALSGLGFLTLLRLADRRDRAPAAALGLFLATSIETVTGTMLGLRAASHASDSKQPGKGLLLGASGALLGIVTTLMNFNWMRTRRRL